MLTILTKFIQQIQVVESLSATAVWAFFCFIFIAYIFYDIKQKKISSEKAWEIRLKEAEADGLMISAIDRLADEIEELRRDIRGGTNV